MARPAEEDEENEGGEPSNAQRGEEGAQVTPLFPDSPAESVSLDLVQRIQKGERAAWNELYQRYHDQLLLCVRMRLGPGLRRFLQSEDIFQSVALEAFQSLQRFEYRGEGSLERYLRTLVVNKIRDRADALAAQKRAGTLARAEVLDEALAESLAAPGPSYHDAPRYERLERALHALGAEQRELIVLRKLEGLSSQEVAARLGLGDDATRKAFSRAMARLTTLLTAPGDP